MPSPEQVAAAAARRRKVLRSIAASINGPGYPPSVSELAAAHGVSTLTIRRDLIHLEEVGKIERDAGVARAIRLKV